MRVLYNEMPVGLHQTICNSKIHACANYYLIQTNYVFWKDVLGKGLSRKPCTFIASRWFEKWWFIAKLDFSMFLMVS